MSCGNDMENFELRTFGRGVQEKLMVSHKYSFLDISTRDKNIVLYPSLAFAHEKYLTFFVIHDGI